MRKFLKILDIILDCAYYGGAFLALILGIATESHWLTLLGIPLSIFCWLRYRKRNKF